MGLLLFVAAAYAVFIPKLGFYWDDWTQLLVARLYPLSTYWQYFASDRPTSAWTHILFVPLLGFKPLHWQIFTLALRGLTVVGMWWCLTMLWPEYKRTITAAALLFAVYPAFRQQPTAVAYHQHWLQFALYFASLGCMILAVQKKKYRAGWMLLALVLELAQFSITEFYAGIELVRPVMLWVALSEEKNSRKRLGKTLLHWVPYFILLLAFSVWRLFFSGIEKHPATLLYLFLQNPLAAIWELLRTASVDELYIVISSWAKTLEMNLAAGGQSYVLLSWLIALISMFALWLFFLHLPETTDERSSARRQMLILGIAVTLVGPSPIWLTGGRILADNDFHADRFAMASMWGISLVIVVLVEFFTQHWRRAALLLSILIGLAVGLQIRIAADYADIWRHQQQFYWQLLWRAPYLQDGTPIISEDIFLAHQELFSTGSAINHLYPQPAQPDMLAYWMYRLTPAYESILPSQDIKFSTQHRIYRFTGTLNNSIIVQYKPEISSCLWVLSDEDFYNPALSPLMREAAIHSNLSTISAIAAQAEGYPPVEMIGSELPHDWCYYYENAELAAQQQDWPAVLSLYSTAQANGYVPQADTPAAAREWLPYIQAQIHQDGFDPAGQLSRELIDYNQDARPMICAVWQSASLPETQDTTYRVWLNHLACN